DTGGVREELVVAEEGRIAHTADRRRALEACSVTPNPARAVWRDRGLLKLVRVERQDHVKLGAVFEQRLCDQDVRARCDRAVSEPHAPARQELAYLPQDASLFGWREPAD